jgi:hypothetical protein
MRRLLSAIIVLLGFVVLALLSNVIWTPVWAEQSSYELQVFQLVQMFDTMAQTEGITDFSTEELRSTLLDQTKSIPEKAQCLIKTVTELHRKIRLQKLQRMIEDPATPPAKRDSAKVLYQELSR